MAPAPSSVAFNAPKGYARKAGVRLSKWDLSESGKRRTSGSIEIEGINGALISVEIVGRKEHGHERQHPPIPHNPEKVVQLLSRG